MGARELRVAFPYNKPVSFYDPIKIQLSPEYTFLENTISPLVEYTPSGELVSAVAEQFYWVGNEAHFKIRKNLRTIDDQIIDAKDVELTFKRIMIVGTNTHGDLKDMLCPNTKMSSLDDDCPGIEIRDNDTTLVLKFNQKKIFLFPMLAAIDFGIIPRGSIDKKNLDITGYRNTSGPYFVLNEDKNGNIELAANPNHFHFKKTMPQHIFLVPVGIKNPEESLALLSQNKIDLITTVDQVSHDRMIRYAQKNSNIHLHKTLPLRTFAVTFTQKGQKRFSITERLSIGAKLKEIFLTTFENHDEYEPSEQLFSVFGEAALTKKQLDAIRYKFSSVQNILNPNKKMLAWIVRMEFFKPDTPALKTNFPKTVFLAVNKVPGLLDFFKNKEDEPDFIVSGPDMGFLEDIGLLSYYLGAGYFHLYKKDADDWLRKYMSVEDKKKRMNLTRVLHFNTIAEGVSIPMAVSPYTALVRKPWSFDLSKVQASDAIWRLNRE